MKLVTSLLEKPWFYRSFQAVWGGTKVRKQFLKEFQIETRNKRILDIGCGIGETLSYIAGPCDYTGFDGNQSYINYASKHFSHGKFYCALVSDKTLEGEGTYDVVMALGVIHHLDDRESHILMDTALKALKKGGQFIAFDGVFIDSQSVLDKYFVAKDRGQFIRTEKEYEKLIRNKFSQIKTKIYSKEFNLPYTAIGIVCTKT